MRKATLLDVVLWLFLAAMWSSSFTVIKIGVETIPPSVLVAGRMVIGCAVLLTVLKLRGLSLSRNASDWLSYTVVGLLSSAVPFLLISYGEQSVDSALTSILMGISPVITLLLATWLISDETLSARLVIGVLGGVAGVATLVGPTALSGLGAELAGQAAIIGATACYATSTVFIKRFVTCPPLELAAGAMMVGAVFSVLASFASGGDWGSVEVSMSSLGSIVYLGVFSTACANLVYFYLVPRLGATRMSQVNFAVPVGGALLGVLVLGEELTLQRFLALVIIIGSVYLGTSKRQSEERQSTGVRSEV